MKFQKGLLDDLKEAKAEPRIEGSLAADEVREKPGFIDDDRLFQTHRRTTRSWRQYVKLLGIVSIFVVIAGGAIFYLTLPRFGDEVRAPRGLEAAVRAHFLDVEKRTSADITFHFCETYYWARVDVEKRPDIKTNPVYQIGTYTARATGNNDAGWNITATPVTSPEMDVPCS